MAPFTRRQFGQAAAAASIGTALGARRVLGANDRVRVGFIAVGNRGDQVLDAFLKHADAQVVAICDIHEPYVDFAARKVGGAAEAVQGLPPAPGHEGPRRGGDQHARPLARAADDPRLRGGQRRLRREAGLARRERGPGDGQRGAAVQPRRPGRAAAALVAVHPGGGGARARRRDRQGDGRALVPRPERVAQGHRQPARRGAARRLRLGGVARVRRRSAPTTGTAPSTASAGSATTRAASSRTSACTTWT